MARLSGPLLTRSGGKPSDGRLRHPIPLNRNNCAQCLASRKRNLAQHCGSRSRPGAPGPTLWLKGRRLSVLLNFWRRQPATGMQRRSRPARHFRDLLDEYARCLDRNQHHPHTGVSKRKNKRVGSDRVRGGHCQKSLMRRIASLAAPEQLAAFLNRRVTASSKLSITIGAGGWACPTNRLRARKCDGDSAAAGRRGFGKTRSGLRSVIVTRSIHHPPPAGSRWSRRPQP